MTNTTICNNNEKREKFCEKINLTILIIWIIILIILEFTT